MQKFVYYVILTVYIILYLHAYLYFIIKYLPTLFSAHFPGYHFCGPGTKFLERISRGEVGVNKLDEACKVHDSVYEKTSDLRTRMEADDVLASQSWKRVKAGDSSFKEKFAALLVTGVMRVKRIWTSRRLRMQRKGKWYQKIVAFFR